MPWAEGASLLYLTFDGHPVFLPGVFVLGAAVGYVAGMFGVGGGFLLTPLLTLVFGVPLPIAVGTGLCQVVATSLVSVLRFREQRRGEQRFDLVMLGGSVMGTEAGTRALTALAEAGTVTLLGRRIAAVNLGVELSYVVIFVVVAVVFWRQGKSGIDRLAYVRRGPLARLPIPPFVDLETVGLARVSAPTIGYVGLLLGFVSGLIGIGGGVALMPILVYGFGFSMQHAAGTGVLMLVVSSSYGTFRHALAGHVSLPLAMTLLLGAPLAATLGSGLTTRLSAATMRRAFSLVVLGAVLAVAWDLARHFSPVASP